MNSNLDLAAEIQFKFYITWLTLVQFIVVILYRLNLLLIGQSLLPVAGRQHLHLR